MTNLSLNREGRWGTIYYFTASSLHLLLFSTALWDSEKSRPVHCLPTSSSVFLVFSLSLCLEKMVLARPCEQEACSHRCVLHLFAGQNIFVWSECLQNHGTNFVSGNRGLMRVRHPNGPTWLYSNVSKFCRIDSPTVSNPTFQ